VVTNPGRWERFVNGLRQRIITTLQRGAERRLAARAF